MQIQNSITNKDKHFLTSFIALDKVLVDSLFHLIMPCFFPIRSKFTLMNSSHREVTFQFLFYTNFSLLVSGFNFRVGISSSLCPLPSQI